MKAELVRLRIKLSETEDADIRKALQDRIAQLEAQMPAPEQPVEEAPPPPATPEQIAEAEKFIVQARVEKMRNNTQAVTDLLRKAAEIAPGAPSVLEAQADDLVERKQFEQAKKVYKRAVQLDPKNVGLERKYAMVVHQSNAMGSFEDQMRHGLGESGLITDSASANAAVLLSVILPGLGHVVIGRKIGFLIMAVWIGCVIWVFSLGDDLKQIVGMAASQGGSPNLTVMIPLLAMAVIYFGTLASLSSAKKTAVKRKVERPVPPVDKPFEL